MIHHILLCTDGSVYSIVAADYATWLAKHLGTPLRALHITDIRHLELPLLADLSGAVGAQPYQAMLPHVQQYHKDKARVILDSVTQTAHKRGVKCSTVHRSGRLIEAILEEEKVADVLVLGQRGENAEHHMDMLGSSVERIVRRSIKPCLVTPGKFAEMTRMMIAYDGSEPSGRSLQQGLTLAAALKTHVSIVTVTTDDVLSADAKLDDAVTLAKRHHITPKTHVLKGHAEAEILHFADHERMNLIVMGAYGHTRIREFIVGSTTSHVLRKAHVPVLLTR
jgi:nucleotide-binding universal stress UspA family protein